MRMRTLSVVSASLFAGLMLACGTSAPAGETNPQAGGTKGGASGSGGGPVGTGGSSGAGTAGGSGGAGGVTGGSGGDTAIAPDASTSAGGAGGTAAAEAGSGDTGVAIIDLPPPDAGPSTWLSKPVGKIPNVGSPASAIGVSRTNWKMGILSPSMAVGKHLNQPTVLNGYLVLNGNEEFYVFDIADIKAPKEVSHFNTPNREPTAGQKKEGEAESHQSSFARYGNSFYEVTLGGRGVNIWNLTDLSKPTHVKAIPLKGCQYDDFTGTTWGVAWQGDTIYVGTTDQGVDILDAKDPNNVQWVKRLTSMEIGGISAGPLFAVGNVLVVTTPKGSGGIATLDISDPVSPKLMSSIKPPQSYIGSFFKHFVFFNNQNPDPATPTTNRPGVRAWDVLTDPFDIGGPLTPYGVLPLDKDYNAEYQSFADNNLYLGHLHSAGVGPGASKIDVTDPKAMKYVEMIHGRQNNSTQDEQFTLQLGSMLVVADDEGGKGLDAYQGAALVAQSTTPDALPPVVDTILPRNAATGVPVTSRIGITTTDNVELVSVTGETFIVRPVGGQPLRGTYGLQLGTLNFDPAEDLLPKTTYEVILKKGGITDLVGNGIAAEFKSTFTTK